MHFPEEGVITPTRLKDMKNKKKSEQNSYTAQKMEFSIKEFFSKCDFFSKSLMENFIFYAVLHQQELEIFLNIELSSKDIGDLLSEEHKCEPRKHLQIQMRQKSFYKKHDETSIFYLIRKPLQHSGNDVLQ